MSEFENWFKERQNITEAKWTTDNIELKFADGKTLKIKATLVNGEARITINRGGK
jgi:hypothetical protein